MLRRPARAWGRVDRGKYTASGQAALTLGHLGPATSVSFSADGNLMATSGADALVRLWPATSLSEADGTDAPTFPDLDE